METFMTGDGNRNRSQIMNKASSGLMSDESPGLTLPERLNELLNGLGIGAAHFCAQAPEDLLGLLAESPSRVASMTLVGANGQPDAFTALGPRAFWITGDRGPIGQAMQRRLGSLPSSQVCTLAGYEQFMWSDTAAERTDEVATAMLSFLAGAEKPGGATPVLAPITVNGAGEIAEVSYRAGGKGTPLILLPLGLSARQWDPLLPTLQTRHCVLVLGGPHLNPVSNLESRAASGYARMALGLLGLVEPKQDETLIEVGCGSGALLRRMLGARGTAHAIGLDVNRFLLDEARALAKREGLADGLELQEGSAEAIPYPDECFDVVFSSTVMEEVNADRMMSELVRVTKPGGSVAVIVRAVDRGQWTNAPLPAAVRQQVETSAGAGGVAAHGCADESLYTRLHDAGLANLRGGPAWVSVSPNQPWWGNVDRQVRNVLDPDAAAVWEQTIAAARVEGSPVWVARPFHCAVGTKS